MIDAKQGTSLFVFVAEQEEKRLRLGEMLRRENLITEAQLEEALRVQQSTGGRIGKILVGLGYINRLVLAQLLSRQLDLPFYNLLQNPPPADIVRLLDEKTALRLEAIPVDAQAGSVTVAFANPLDAKALSEVEACLGKPVKKAITSTNDVQWILERVYRQNYIDKSTTELLYRHPEESAAETFTTPQLLVLFGLLFFGLIALLLRPVDVFVAVNTFAALGYLAVAAYRLFLVYRGATRNLTIKTPTEEIAAAQDKDLPVYTILIPLYGELAVLPALLDAVAKLDYPPTRLDVRFLFEESDPQMLAAAKAYRPPAHFQFVVVPDSLPRTKPKACNYGLIQAVGQYCVIYDAEDIPEPDQLKKAVAAFRHAPADVICLQAKLNYYNRDQNLLTRWFTAEYSMWFDLCLPGLDAAAAPIPLGGTSNHFVTEKLRELGAWDPYNVTEDADLGMRLHKAGYRTGILDSTTYEEANSQLPNWMRQRSRWVKGYMQTWLVHMRNPVKLWQALGAKSFFGFQMIVGGTPFTFMANPIFWALTALWFLIRWNLIAGTFPPVIYYIAVGSLLAGNFIFVYLNVVGCYRRGYYDLVNYALLSPIYWVLMSIATWRVLFQLFVRPSYWEKTVHGLHTHYLAKDSK